jgi:hypothetical protein
MELKSSVFPFHGEKADILWAAVVFIFVFTVYFLCPATTSTDSRWTFYLFMSMLREQNAPECVWDMQVLRGTCEDKLEGLAPLCWFYPGESK